MFTDQAYSQIHLAEDEARMLNRAAVEPEHLLLALARSGNVAALLAEHGVAAGEIRDAVVALHGFGDDLALGAVPRSAATEDALDLAVSVAAERGVIGASSEHLLLGIGDAPVVTAVLSDLGISNVTSLVDAVYPAHAPPVPSTQVTRLALRAARRWDSPQVILIPPVFERYTVQARASIKAAESAAASLMNERVSSFHFLIGALDTGDNLAAATLEAHGITYEQLMRAARITGPGTATLAPGIFDRQAHLTVSQGALKHAYRRSDPHIGSGHLLLAILDCPSSMTDRLIGSRVLAEHITRECLARLPGDEQP
jgi:ATP-dependent Clp protease ATP-binding subunit ClpA